MWWLCTDRSCGFIPVWKSKGGFVPAWTKSPFRCGRFGAWCYTTVMSAHFTGTTRCSSDSGASDLASDAPTGEHDAVVQLGRLVDERGEQLLHAHGAAPAVDVAGQRQQFARLDHCDGLFPGGLRGLLQVKLAGNGNHEHVVLPRFRLRHQRFEHAIGVLPQRGGHFHAGQRLRALEIANGEIGVRRIHLAHGVGLMLLFFRHAKLLLSNDSILIQVSRNYGSWSAFQTSRAYTLY